MINHVEVQKNGKKMVEKTMQNKLSENVKDCLFGFASGGAGKPPTPSTQFTSLTQYSMLQGQGLQTDVRFNTEQKIIREQVLAALRKLDAGKYPLLFVVEFHFVIRRIKRQ